MSNESLSIDDKYNKLLELISKMQNVAVAFSGGVDSSFLCYAAAQALGSKALAITLITPMLPQFEIDDAKIFAQKIGIKHILVNTLDVPDAVAENSEKRCYFCKKIAFNFILETAKKHGISVVLDGSNFDDLSDYRPGLRALQELCILSPLKEVELTKAEIRELSQKFGLPSWDKPAYACLASRIPYGEKIDAEKLNKIEKAEDCLRSFGFRQFRVRMHGSIARIEVAPEERKRFFDERFLDEISTKIKAIGFLYVAFELEGYAMGSLNRTFGNL